MEISELTGLPELPEGYFWRVGETRSEFGSIFAPHFDPIKGGELFSVDYQIWKIQQIETEYDPARAEHRLRITAKSVRTGL